MKLKIATIALIVLGVVIGAVAVWAWDQSTSLNLYADRNAEVAAQ